LEAAIRGRGRWPLARRSSPPTISAAGRLVKPFERPSVALGFGLLHRLTRAKAGQQKLLLFRNWLYGEADSAAS